MVLLGSLITTFRRTLSHNFKVLKHKMMPNTNRTYQDAIVALNNLQTNVQYIKNAVNQPHKSKDNIALVTKYLKRSGLPVEELDKMSFIHIAGTNGKGSTCAYCESILRNHGYKTGFYSSPHLIDVRERIRINGKPISKNEFATYFWKMYDLLDAQKANSDDMPLYFRYLTILAFHIFREYKVDVAIIEVGIGGEYDCTNVIRKTAVAGITSLDIDHTVLLGHSIESIAWNKAGIMKSGGMAFTVEQPERALNVLMERSLERNCSLTVVDTNCYSAQNSRFPFHIQKTNASLALAISEAYIKRVSACDNAKQFSLELAIKSIEETRWPGRYEMKQLKNVRFYLDGAHTIESISVCAEWFDRNTASSNRARVLIFNLTGDRNADTFFKLLYKLKFDIVIFTPNVGSENDAMDTADYKFSADSQLKRFEEFGKRWREIEDNTKRQANIKVFPCFSKAVNFLDDANEYDVLVTGSIHLVGAALNVLDPTLNGVLDD